MEKLKISIIIMMTLLTQVMISQTSKETKKAACCAMSDSGKMDAHCDDMVSDIPNVPLLNQHGESVNFHDLIKGKVVALNFIFTSCKTICPPMGANFAHLKKMMSKRVKSSELVMLTISIDPITDTPERLLEWSKKFEAGPGWTLLTGEKKDVNTILKKLEVYTAVKEEHAPVIVLGKEGENNWVRTNGLAEPKELAKTLNTFFGKPKSGHTSTEHNKVETINRDENYFTNVELINQYGDTMRLYTDLMKDKVVIINPFFSECKGVCPMMSSNLEKIQEHLGDKLGNDVHIISMTVDHETDQENILKSYAEAYNARKGWYFVTGEKENIELALTKLGKNVTNREGHDSIFLIGNLNTKLWKKVNGLAAVDDIIAQVDSVINDRIE
ncbi:SCO family protein [Aquimarina sp. 2201CG14-23]|uniref:SCO family protein n=1 Tax=Aquimarina mycalae TaxID=3040073 RepID=UPI002477D157|nr:SCO family protein [Aquimarina sp. 2201CG14-23]MDH7448116.1 SCO family protein [Aquimarina sp. 2201CG14-23]